MPTGAAATAQVIAPRDDGSVDVGWIGRSSGRNRVHVSNWSRSAGFGESTELYSTTRQLWGLKLESTSERKNLLCVIDGPYGAYRTRVIKYDEDFQWEAQTQWSSDVNVLPTGRMLGGQDRLILSRTLNTAWGRYINAASLAAAPWFVIQYERPPANDAYSYYYGNYYDYSFKLPPRGASSIDTAIAPDGSVTALYDFGGIRMKKFALDGSVTLKMRIDGRPYSGLEKLVKTSGDVLDDQTTLLAWVWHNYYFSGASIVMFSAENFFRGIRVDGSASPSIRLQPESTKPDIQDTPSAALRVDGTGAAAWTVRTKQGATVWLQRLNHMLEPSEPARIVDARPGFRTDKPMLRSDGANGLFLSWRCTSTTGAPSEIGFMNLNSLDSAPPDPSISMEEGGVKIDWSAPPACTVRLWHSDTPDYGSATPICTEESIGGERAMLHETGASRGFYWLSTD